MNKYRVDLLRNNIKVMELDALSCSITYNADAVIKKSARVQILKNDKIDMIRDRVRPVIIDDEGEHPCGVYVIASCPMTSSFYSLMDLELYDESYIIQQSTITDRMYIAAGTNYIDVISQIITSCGLTNVSSVANTAVTSNDREYEIGTSKIAIINDLLAEINYNSIHVNDDGIIVLDEIKEKTVPDFVYRSNDHSKIIDAVTQTTDFYNVPNVFVGVVSSPDNTLMKYVKKNNDFNSKLSIMNRGYEVAKIYRLSNIANHDELVKYIDNEAIKAMSAEEKVTIRTDIETGHEYKCIVQVDTDEVKGLYTEMSYSFDFEGTMSHVLKRQVLL